MTAKATAAIVWKTDVYGITRGGGYTIECVNNGRDRTSYFYRVFHNGHAIPDVTPDRRLWPLSAAKRKAEQHAKSTVSPATPTEENP